MISPLLSLISLFILPFVVLLIGRATNLRIAKAVALLVIASSGLAFYLNPTASFAISFMNLDLVLFKLDGLSHLLALVFHLAGFVAVIYSWDDSKLAEFAASLFYFASAIGLTACADMFSFFVYWELLTIGATLLIALGRKEALAAASRYFLFHIVGGLVLLAGIVHLYYSTGDIGFRKLELDNIGSWLIFLGIGVNAGFPLLHTWITDAYPRASASATVWMSAITTKTAVYALIRFFPGEELLVWIGVVMMVFPVFFAVIENNLRRVLSYSLINQVGLIITAIGLGTGLSMAGGTAHIVTDIFFKGLLFMSVGAVLYRTGYQSATDLGGLYKSMPYTCFFCIVAALSISAFPFFSGFVSKAMVVSAAAGADQYVVWVFLLFASAAVLEHAGIKVPFFTFFAHDSGKRPKEAPLSMLIAMGMMAVLCVTIGIFPELLYSRLPFDFKYEPYTFEHIITQMELLLAAALAFILMLLAGIYPAEKRGRNLDMDYFFGTSLTRLNNVFAKTTNKLNDYTNRIVAVDFIDSAKKFSKNYPGNLLKLVNKNSSSWHEAVMDGTLPLAFSIFFALLIFLFLAF